MMRNAYVPPILDAEYQELRGFDGWADNIIDMIVDEGTKTAKGGVKRLTDLAPNAIEDVLRSTQFRKVLEAVETQARQAVVVETQKNALNLMLLAIAGGAVGGYIFRGTFGALAASAIAVYAGAQLLDSGKR